MAKRFTDTEKWKKPFLRNLKAPYKLLWFFICDECDHSGIWQVDFAVAAIKIGERVNEKDAIKFLSDKIVVFDNGEKWFIPSFIEFQYGQLSENNRAHTKVIYNLKKYNLIDEELIIKPLISPLQAPMDMEEEKEVDKEQDMEEEKSRNEAFEKFNIWLKNNAPQVCKLKEQLTEKQFDTLLAKHDKSIITDTLIQMHNWKPLLTKNLSVYYTLVDWISRRK